MAQSDSLQQKSALTDSIWQLGEIEITASKKVPLLQTTTMGQWSISSEALKQIPHLLGDADPMKVSNFYRVSITVVN